LWAIEGSEEDGDAVSLKKRRMNSDSSGPEESQLEVLATFYSEFTDL
jgi:ribosome biogenesis protein YTM1